MSEVSKNELKYDNSVSFPNNNNGAITPAGLRNFNVDLIDSTVNQTTYNQESASFTSRIIDANTDIAGLISTASVNLDVLTFTKFNGSSFSLAVTASAVNVEWNNVLNRPAGLVSGSSQVVSILTPLNAFSSSQLTKDSTLASYTGSINAFTASENTKASTLAAYTGSINSFTSSVNTKFNAVGNYTSSMNTYTSSNDTKWNTLGTQSGSFARTDISNTFNATQNITGDLNITGTIRATTIHTITESASVIFSSGSNVFGDASNDVQTLNGSTIINGSLTATGSTILNGNTLITGSLTATNGIIGSIQATNNVISGSSQILALGYATTGSNTFVGKQTIAGAFNGIALTGSNSYIDLTGTNSHISMYSGIGSIRFYTGSADGDGTSNRDTWVNMQVNPANGALAISAFPSNNHFVDFDVEQTASVFTAPLKGMFGNVRFVSGIEMTGSIFAGDEGFDKAFLGYYGTVGTLHPADLSEVGFAASPIAPGGWNGPAIYTFDATTNDYPTSIGFQSVSNWTDGRVTVLPLLAAQSGSEITGSVRGNVRTQGITSNTASLDFSTSNFFTITLGGGNTRIEATNVRPGQTVSLQINQTGLGDSTVTLAPQFKFPSISPYTTTQSGSAVDVLTFVTFNDTSSIYSAGVNNLR
jgi:hypothetical protein